MPFCAKRIALHHLSTTTAVDARNQLITAASFPATTIVEAEEMTIVLGISHNPEAIIFTDVQAACRNYVHNTTQVTAITQLDRISPTSAHIFWIPGRSSNAGNEVADVN